MSKTGEKEFICRGRVTLDNVTFRIVAKSREHAETLARQGKFDDYDTTTAEGVDWEMRPETVETNE